MILRNIETAAHVWVGRCNDGVRNYGPRKFMEVKGVCGIAVEGAVGGAINLSHIRWDSEYHHWCDTLYVTECIEYGLTPRGVLSFNAHNDLICHTTRFQKSKIWNITMVDHGGNFLFDWDDRESFLSRVRTGKEILERCVLLPQWKLVHGEYIVEGIDVRDFTQ